MSRLIKGSLPCESCGSSDAKAIYEDNEYCFSCHNYKSFNKTFLDTKLKSSFKGTLPYDFTLNMPPEASIWLLGVGIEPDTWKKYNIGYSDKYKSIVIPMRRRTELKGYQLKPIDKSTAKYYTVGDKYPFHCMNNIGIREVVLVEDVRSALRLCGHVNSIALMGTTMSKEFQFALLCECAKITIWLDGDKAGIDASKEIHSKLALAANVICITTKKDPKWYSDKEIEEILNDC